MSAELCEALLGLPPRPGLSVGPAERVDLTEYHRLRRIAFCDELGLFDGSDLDGHDGEAGTVVLVARLPGSGRVVGGVRLFEVSPGWWQGSRLAVAADQRGSAGVGRALVAAAVQQAEARGALRFEATVVPGNAVLFARLGWDVLGPVEVAGAPHVLVRYPIGRIARLVATTKAALGGLLTGFAPGGPGFVGDDCAPVPGSDVLASVDAILPSMVAGDPEWAGWCGVLVGAGDLAASGASPKGLLDALAAPTAAHAARVLAGLRAGSEAFGLPVLGGHTQLGVAAALSVTALGTTSNPVAGAGRAGQAVSLTADLGGRWRPGHAGHTGNSGQWDSSSRRTAAELRAMTRVVARGRPAAAKDVSMAGIAGTLGMLAEASGCGAELDVADVPRPGDATVGDWLTCFPGFAMLTADEPGRALPPAGPAVTQECGRLVPGAGVRLRWPDGELTEVVSGPVTGLGRAS